MICAGNWKMNKNPDEATSYVSSLSSSLRSGEEQKLILLVPALCFSSVAQGLKKTKIGWGGQNCHWQDSGAFTGENSVQVMAQMGATHCLVGHSERRQFFGETNKTCAQKIAALQKHKIIPIYCIGETLAERDSNVTEKVIATQLQEGLAADIKPNLILAYEPVWAIGTGRVASTEQIKAVHGFIRAWLKENRAPFKDTAILYGGSVKPDNAKAIASTPEVGGFLVGGASLVANDFLNILRA